MIKTSTFTFIILAVVLVTGSISLSTISDTVFAQKNGWGKATSEEAQEDGKSFGAHASGQDDDPNGPGEPPFDSDGKPGRQGIGNLADHPNDLGELLDCLNQDDADDPDPSEC